MDRIISRKRGRHRGPRDDPLRQQNLLGLPRRESVAQAQTLADEIRNRQHRFPEAPKVPMLTMARVERDCRLYGKEHAGLQNRATQGNLARSRTLAGPGDYCWSMPTAASIKMSAARPTDTVIVFKHKIRPDLATTPRPHRQGSRATSGRGEGIYSMSATIAPPERVRPAQEEARRLSAGR